MRGSISNIYPRIVLLHSSYKAIKHWPTFILLITLLGMKLAHLFINSINLELYIERHIMQRFFVQRTCQNGNDSRSGMQSAPSKLHLIKGRPSYKTSCLFETQPFHTETLQSIYVLSLYAREIHLTENDNAICLLSAPCLALDRPFAYTFSGQVMYLPVPYAR